jgi:hypothetical protein
MCWAVVTLEGAVSCCGDDRVRGHFRPGYWFWSSWQVTPMLKKLFEPAAAQNDTQPFAQLERADMAFRNVHV